MYDDEPPSTIKLGMLTSSTTILALASFLRNLPARPPVILDPVMVSTSGHTLLPDDAVSAITSELLQQVDLVTPNIPEAQRLVGWDEPVQNLGDMVRLAQRTADLCHVPNLLLKGGHLSVSREEVLGLSGDYKVIWDEGDEEEDTVEVLSRFGGKRGTELVVDILVEGAGETRKLFVGRKVDSTSTHGTGCTLSSVLACAWALRRRDHPDDGESSLCTRTAIQANMAEKGFELIMSIVDEKTLETICKTATAYTRSAIASAFPFGKGHGPLNHSHLTYPRALPPCVPPSPH